MPGVSQVELAKKLGVSQMTVSKALRGETDISPKMRQRVESLAARLGYRPNLLARSLADGRTYSVGVLAPRSRGYFHAIFRETLEDKLLRSDYFPITLRGGFDEKADQKTLQLFMQYQVDGVIVACPHELLPQEFFVELIDRDFPLVFTTDFPHPKSCRVINNDTQGMEDAVNYLINLGHRKIACLKPVSANLEYVLDRKTGYQQSIKAAKFEDIQLEFDSTEDLRNKLLGGIKSGITGIVCVSDEDALMVAKICESEKIKIPSQLSIVGFANNFHYPEEMKIPLTTVAHDPLKVGKIVVDLLIRKISGEKISGLHPVNNRIIERSSTGRPLIKNI